MRDIVQFNLRRYFYIAPLASRIFGQVENGSCGTSYAVGEGSLHCVGMLRHGTQRRVHLKRVMYRGDVTRSLMRVFRILCRTQCPVREVILISRCRTDSSHSVTSGGDSYFGCEHVTNDGHLSHRDVKVTISVGPLCGPRMAGEGSKAAQYGPTASGTCVGQGARCPCVVGPGSLYYGLFGGCKFA